MDSLVLRGDVVTVQEITYQIQGKLNIDIHEAVDIVYDTLLKFSDKMTYWRVPQKGIPVGLIRDENNPYDYSASFFNSRWWDAEWRIKLDATLEKFGGSDRDMENVEGLAILRSDMLEYFPFLSGESSAEAHTNEVDPSDSPPELDAANMAFRAVSNGYGNQSATARNRLIEYLEKHYPSFKVEQVQRIATVANPDKSTGRKKNGKE